MKICEDIFGNDRVDEEPSKIQHFDQHKTVKNMVHFHWGIGYLEQWYEQKVVTHEAVMQSYYVKTETHLKKTLTPLQSKTYIAK